MDKKQKIESLRTAIKVAESCGAGGVVVSYPKLIEETYDMIVKIMEKIEADHAQPSSE